MARESKIERDAAFILRDMRTNGFGSQGSWDWPADLRFAEHMGDRDAIDLYRDILKSHAPFPFQIAAQKRVDHVRRRRLRALRLLVKQGHVEAWWLGAGVGGHTEFGVRRLRAYALKGSQWPSTTTTPSTTSTSWRRPDE